MLHDACGRAGLKSASLWAAVPALRLADAVAAGGEGARRPPGRAARADVDTAELDEAADAYAQQVSEAVAADDGDVAYVEELERRVDELAAEEDLPSGESIAAELTRYLRERENGTDGDDVARDQ